MPRKQSGGSPASTNVMNINTGYLNALAETPVGGQVSGLKSCQSGGSIASNRVTDLLSQEQCGGVTIPASPAIAGDPANLPLYKTSGGGKKKRKVQKAGGSDFVNLLYARGPVNTPSNPNLFKNFAGPYDQFISNECLYTEGLKGAAPFPFPQKGGKKSRTKSKSKSKSKSKKHMKKHIKKVKTSVRRKMKKTLNRKHRK